MDLSVIIPAKNEALLIRRCLEAIQASIRKASIAAEIIVVDNASTDKTPTIAETMASRVLIKSRGSISALRNAGAREATGRFLAFLDADCVVADDWVAYCMEQITNDGVGAVGTKAVPDAASATWVTWAWYRLGAGSSRGESVAWLGTSNLMLRREDFFNIGGFDERLAVAEDIDFCFRLRAHYTIRLEKRIDTLHLREVTTLGGFFRKEIWRGQDSCRCLVKNRFRREDIPSVAVPALFLVLFAALVGLVFAQSRWAVLPLLTLLCLPILLMVRKGASFSPVKLALHCWIVGLSFITARSLALAREVPRILWSCR